MDNQEKYDLIIEAGHTESLYWQDLLKYKELFYFLAWRDILARHKQTAIGIAWSVLQPLLTMFVFFRYYLAKLQNYLLMVYCIQYWYLLRC